jgi:hypothetical protein
MERPIENYPDNEKNQGNADREELSGGIKNLFITIMAMGSFAILAGF